MREVHVVTKIIAFIGILSGFIVFGLVILAIF